MLHLGSWVSLRAETPAATSTLQDLLRVQMAVQTALPLVRTALVALETQDGAASGVIVSPDGIVFTAAHVVSDAKKQPRPGMKVKIFLHDGLESKGTALGMDVATDAAMIQLDGKRKDWPFVELRRTGPEVLPGDWCFALGHPGGHDEKRGDVLRVGKVIKVMPNGLQSDCVLMGGDSGRFPPRGGGFAPRGGGRGGGGGGGGGGKRTEHRIEISGLPLSASWQDLKDIFRQVRRYL